MRYAHIIEQVYQRPWLITPSAHAAIRTIVERHLDPCAAVHDGQALDFADFVNARPAYQLDENAVAHISIAGVIGKGISKIERTCGACGIEDIHADLDQAASAQVRGIMFHYNSPGGTVTGVPELSQRIRDISVPTLAYTEDLAASAAYYMAAGADTLIASRSADVGSIGVYIPWIDQSAYWENLGIKADPIINSGGDHKATGFSPTLTADQRAYLQEMVDESFADFRAFVTAEREISPDALTGKVFSGERAEALGLTDGVGDRQVAYTRLLSQIQTAA